MAITAYFKLNKQCENQAPEFPRSTFANERVNKLFTAQEIIFQLRLAFALAAVLPRHLAVF